VFKIWKNPKCIEDYTAHVQRDLHSRVNALHEKITGCDSDLATLIGGINLLIEYDSLLLIFENACIMIKQWELTGGQNGLQLAIKICKGDSDECLDEDDNEEASLPLEVLRRTRQQKEKLPDADKLHRGIFRIS
jgi:hypothetical protein